MRLEVSCTSSEIRSKPQTAVHSLGCSTTWMYTRHRNSPSRAWLLLRFLLPLAGVISLFFIAMRRVPGNLSSLNMMEMDLSTHCSFSIWASVALGLPPRAIEWTVFDIMPFHGGLIMIHLINAHTGHFPAQTFSGTVWLLQLKFRTPILRRNLAPEIA